jgi:hypothetical protein
MRNIALAVVALAVVLAGCGGNDDKTTTRTGTPEEQIRAVIDDLNSAVRDHDGARVCNELYSERLVSRMKAAGLDCVKAIDEGTATPSYEVQRVTVDRNRARVEVRARGAGPEAQVIIVTREDDGWRIIDAGD